MAWSRENMHASEEHMNNGPEKKGNLGHQCRCNHIESTEMGCVVFGQLKWEKVVFCQLKWDFCQLKWKNVVSCQLKGENVFFDN